MRRFTLFEDGRVAGGSFTLSAKENILQKLSPFEMLFEVASASKSNLVSGIAARPAALPSVGRMVGVAHASKGSTPTVPRRTAGARRRSVPASAVFDFDADKESGSSVLSLAQQDRFKADFYRDMTSLAAWCAAERWRPPSAGGLRVFVSSDFKISKSLVPAWFGHSGHMEFPAWRVAAGEAAIAHELVHVFFPNGNRFLAEGLAVYLQAKLGGNPAFPNLGRDLHELAHEVLRDMLPQVRRGNLAGLSRVKLVDLDRISTPSPLKLRVGRKLYDEDPFGQAHIYPLVGSFVAFLVETHGTRKFRALFMQTPLVPLECDAGPADRWIDVYGLSLADLEGQWKAMIASRNSHHRSEI